MEFYDLSAHYFAGTTIHAHMSFRVSHEDGRTIVYCGHYKINLDHKLALLSLCDALRPDTDLSFGRPVPDRLDGYFSDRFLESTDERLWAAVARRAANTRDPINRRDLEYARRSIIQLAEEGAMQYL